MDKNHKNNSESREEVKHDNEENNPQESLEMDLENKYSEKKQPIAENVSEAQKEMQKTKKEIEKLKAFIIKTYPFTQAIGILPPQAIKIFIDEEEVPKETEKFMHLYMIIPEEKFKEIPKIKQEIVKKIEETKQKIWVQIKTPVDIWENCLDSKFNVTEAIAMSYPVFDKGILGLLRMSEIHKSLVLQKFEKYVVSYVVVGSFVRGDATPTSDADVFIVINDTDVKRMPRLELKERLRGIIYQYVQEAAALAGVKNTLHIQTYLLTEFWESVKDAHPVIFTMIRDGVPLYDRGTFMPWKALLKMGKLKPSPEAIDLFMKTAEKTKEIVERRLVDAVVDIYYGVLTPSQALLMLYGVPPPTHKETVKMLNDIFVEKEKMLKKADIDIVEKSVKLFKEYEHNPQMKISGKEIDQMVKESDAYLKRLKELREQIEKRSHEKTLEQIYTDLIKLLEAIFGKKSQQALVEEFEKKLVKTGKLSHQHLRILNDVITAKSEFKKGKMDSQKVDNARKNAAILINDLVEYTQRCELSNLEKGRMRIKYQKEGKDKLAELLLCNDASFLFVDGNVRKITDKAENSNMEEVTKAVEAQKAKKELECNSKIFDLVKHELGNFEIVM